MHTPFVQAVPALQVAALQYQHGSTSTRKGISGRIGERVSSSTRKGIKRISRSIGERVSTSIRKGISGRNSWRTIVPALGGAVVGALASA